MVFFGLQVVDLWNLLPEGEDPMQIKSNYSTDDATSDTEGQSRG